MTRATRSTRTEDVRQLLLEIALGVTDVDKLLAAGSAAASPAELRDSLDIDYGQFNEVLRELHGVRAGPQRRGSPGGHGDFVQTNRAVLMDDLRSRYVRAFWDPAPLDAYVEARSLDITPEPGWLDMYDLPPEEAMQARVAEWMGARRSIGDACASQRGGRPRAEQRAGRLPARRRPLRRWCPRGRGRTARHSMRSGRRTARCQRSACSPQRWRSGLVVLDQPKVLAWLRAAGLWPTDIALSLSPADVGLTEADMASQEDVAQTEKLERQRRRRIVVLDDVGCSRSATTTRRYSST